MKNIYIHSFPGAKEVVASVIWEKHGSQIIGAMTVYSGSGVYQNQSFAALLDKAGDLAHFYAYDGVLAERDTWDVDYVDEDADIPIATEQQATLSEELMDDLFVTIDTADEDLEEYDTWVYMDLSDEVIRINPAKRSLFEHTKDSDVDVLYFKRLTDNTSEHNLEKIFEYRGIPALFGNLLSVTH